MNKREFKKLSFENQMNYIEKAKAENENKRREFKARLKEIAKEMKDFEETRNMLVSVYENDGLNIDDDWHETKEGINVYDTVCDLGFYCDAYDMIKYLATEI